MAIDLKGYNGLVVNATSDNELQVGLQKDITKVGSVGVVAEVHDGSSGVGRLVRPIDVSADYRVRVGADSMVYYDNFSHGVINAKKYKVVSSTILNAMASLGYWSLNSTNLTTAGYSVIQTFGTFPLYLSYSLYFELEMGMTFPEATNNVCEWGFAHASQNIAPTDGVFFRKNGGGQLLGVTNFGGFETTVTLDFPMMNGEFYHWLIIIHNDECQFWIDDIPYGVIETPHSNGSPIKSMSCPILFRNYNSLVSDLANTMMVSNVLVSNGDMFQNKPFSHIMSGCGNHCSIAPDGSPTGQTCNYANSINPTSVTLSNTAGGYTTLGGQFQFASVVGSETDYALFGYQVPAGTNAIPSKELVVSEIVIDTFNMGAVVATTPNLLQWFVSVGGTAVALNTADSVTAGTRAGLRIPLGIQYLPVGAVIGQPADKTIKVTFDPPLVCEQNSWFVIGFKMPVGTATASQIIRGIVNVNGHFE
jgi:hypothetical protein